MRRSCRFEFQSTSPVWRTTHYLNSSRKRQTISIHVPRVEDDMQKEKNNDRKRISIHVPRVEDDSQREQKDRLHTPFQSTSPVWRTTKIVLPRPLGGRISIHVPRVEDDETRRMRGRLDLRFQSTSPVWRTTTRMHTWRSARAISIHVPRVEDDRQTVTNPDSRKHFNPRPPCGGRQKIEIFMR